LRFIGTFESEEITHVEGDVNPVRDIEIINEELRLKDEESLNAAIKKTESLMRTDKKMKTEYVMQIYTIILLHSIAQFF
jgi:obg-like ATPase 1